MIINITRSGGFTGIPFTKTIDTKDLPPDKAKEIEELISKSNLPSYAKATEGKPDRFSYTITTEDNAVNQNITISETELTQELREIIGNF